MNKRQSWLLVIGAIVLVGVVLLVVFVSEDGVEDIGEGVEELGDSIQDATD